MTSPFKLDGSIDEQVEKAHEIIGNVASGLRTFKKSIPAGSLINCNPCGDEDLYLGQVIGNLVDELKVRDQALKEILNQDAVAQSFPQSDRIKLALVNAKGKLEEGKTLDASLEDAKNATIKTCRFLKPNEVHSATRDEVIDILASSQVRFVYREFSDKPVSVPKILEEHKDWKERYSHALDAKQFAIAHVTGTDNDFAIVERYPNGLYSVICGSCPCKASGSYAPIKYESK